MNLQDTVKALDSLCPNALCKIDGTGKIIEWMDNRPKPTLKEIEFKIKELKQQEKINNLYKDCSNYIYKHYPQEKQSSDLADKIFYENVLKAGGYQNLETDVVSFVINFKNGKSIEDILKDVEDKQKEGVEQLIKVGIRVDWVQQCKKELKEALKEGREPNYPKYPL